MSEDSGSLDEAVGDGVVRDGATPQGTTPAQASPGPAAPGKQPSGRGDGRRDARAPAPETPPLDLDALPSGVRGAVESILMVVEEPVTDTTLASALGLPRARVRETLAELVADYDSTGRGFELRKVAGGWRIYSREEYAPVVERFMIDGQTARLTQAALETLAIVAYRQPVSRARVSAVRGVNVDGVMRTLVTRGLVEEAATDSETGAILYRTTSHFLERMGMDSLEELPALAPYLPEVDSLDEIGSAT